MPQTSITGTVPFFDRQPPQQVLEEGVRLDGRGYEEFRAVCKCSDVITIQALRALHARSVSRFLCCAVLNTGAISQATGSAYAEFSKTKVMAAV